MTGDPNPDAPILLHAGHRPDANEDWCSLFKVELNAEDGLPLSTSVSDALATSL